jgi:hypothetical protein
MIDQATFDNFKRNYRESGEITPELYRLLLRLVAAAAHSGLPPALSPTGRWDQEGALEAAHGWIEARLLRTKALIAAFDHADAPRPFLRSLERNFRHHLQNQRQGDELANLISRTLRLLRDDDSFTAFVEARKPSDQWWGLSEWTEPVPWQGSDAQLVAEAWAAGTFQVFRYSQRVERASPILATDELRRFLGVFFGRLQKLLTGAHLAVVYRDRFDLGSPQSLELDDQIEAEVSGKEEPSDGEVAGAAIAVLAELTARRVDALLLSAEGKTLEEIAENLGVSRGTADNELKRCAPVIDRHCTDGVNRAKILEKIIDSLS